MTMNVLMIDDQSPEQLEGIITLIRETYPSCELHGFDHIDETLNNNWDVIILDYKKDNEIAGIEWFERIWEKKFFPIIFHTAYFEELTESLSQDEYINHPLVKITKKSSRSSSVLLKALEDAEQIIKTINEFESNFGRDYKVIQQDTLKYTLQFLNREDLIKNPSKYASLLTRRLANYLENQIQEELEPFEMYIYPPISDSLLVGDIIKENGKENYFVILTPSCDLVDRQGAVKKVHLAQLESSNLILNIAGLENAGVGKIKEKLPKMILNQGYSFGVFPLPPLVHYFDKSMAINLKKCIYIDRYMIHTSDELQTDGESQTNSYIRIASIDSPFRETIVWAYMSIACRPGLPDRDVEKWAKNIYDENHQETAEQ